MGLMGEGGGGERIELSGPSLRICYQRTLMTQCEGICGFSFFSCLWPAFRLWACSCVWVLPYSSPPPTLFQAQLPITPLTAAYRKKTIATPGSHESLLAYFWPWVLAALYTLSFTFLSAIIGWSDWANPFSFWHSLCCQRYSGSCSGKLTLKFP